MKFGRLVYSYSLESPTLVTSSVLECPVTRFARTRKVPIQRAGLERDSRETVTLVSVGAYMFRVCRMTELGGGRHMGRCTVQPAGARRGSVLVQALKRKEVTQTVIRVACVAAITWPSPDYCISCVLARYWLVGLT